ncbi:MAG: hypothetical protein OXN27_16030 [Candidatus Poribacteria bacterium]|nr:hypothetical protein [Candidatus Poribacteria bacterium]
MVLTLLHRYRPYGVEEGFYKEARIQSSPAGGGYNPRQREVGAILDSGGADGIRRMPATISVRTAYGVCLLQFLRF